MRTTIARVVDTLKALVGLADYPHSYLCFAHGGSAACEAMNRRLGFTCPKCTKPNDPAVARQSPEAGGSALPRINIRCEYSEGLVHGSRYLKVIRVEPEDDGSFTAVTDHWPNAAPQPERNAIG